MHFYAISRLDLPTHQQAIQSAHAQLEYCREVGVPEGEHPSFVWLTVEDKWGLLQLATVLLAHDIELVEFHDPDYKGYDPSAIACMVPHESRYLLSHLPLWKCEAPRKNKGLYEWLTKRGKFN